MTAVLRPRTIALAVAATLVAGLVVAVPRAGAVQEIHRVPSEQPTIQAAVDAASPGDLILVEPGVYTESVSVPEDKPNLTIRGLDRNEVVLDGEHMRDIGISTYADGTVLENMTSRNHTRHGFYWRGLDGYEGRYLTAYNNQAYGIYAFDSINGIFEDSYASGSADASFYIGNCRPCHAVIRNVIAEHSALGYSGTNAGGDLVIEDSVWQHNAAGIVPNSLNSQDDPPQRGGTLITGNVISSNGNPNTPGEGTAGAVIGHGVAIAGGHENVIENNVIEGNTKYGVVLFPMPETEPGPYLAAHNTVRDNVLDGNELADLALAAPSGEGNCFEGNEFAVSAPLLIEDAWPCAGDGLNAFDGPGDPAVSAVLAADYAVSFTPLSNRPSYQDMPAPPPQPTMPDPDPEA